MTIQSEEISAEDSLNRSLADLDNFEDDIKLPLPRNNIDVDRYFTMDRKELENLSREECGQIAYELAQYSFWIQKTINRESAKVSWAEAKLSIYIGKVSKKYKTDKYISFDELKGLITADDSYAGKLFAIKMQAKLRVDRLFFLSGKIEYMSKTIKELKYLKGVE